MLKRKKIENAEEQNRRTFWQKILIAFFVLIFLLCSVHALRRISSRISRDFMSPFLQAATLSANFTYRMQEMVEPKSRLAAKVSVLDKQNVLLAAENVRMKQLAEENRQLRALLNLKSNVHFTPVPAEIIGRSSALWRERFVLNRGADDGIRPGDTVAAPTSSGKMALAGRVVEVSNSTCVVSTIFSEECRVSAAVKADSSVGVMRYSSKDEQLVVSYLPVQGNYKPGELVETSGIADRTPGGLAIGVIAGESGKATAVIQDHLYAELHVTPFIRIDSVYLVAVYASAAGGGK